MLIKMEDFMKRFFLGIVMLTIIITACKPPEPKPKSYYMQNEAERIKLVNELKDNPGKYKNDPDHINADSAEADIKYKKELDHFFGHDKK